MATPRSPWSLRTMNCSTLPWMGNLTKRRASPQLFVVNCTKVNHHRKPESAPIDKIATEHLGLIEPQVADSRDPEITSFMRPAPYPNKDQTRTHEDGLVADPLSDATNSLWMSTARKNREVFTELFHPLPTNLVQNWDAYEARPTSMPLIC